MDPDAAERDAWVILAGVHGVGPVSFERLVRAYGSAGAVLHAAGRRGEVARLVAASRDSEGGPATLTPDAARAIADAAREVDRRLAPTRAAGVHVLTLADEAYPAPAPDRAAAARPVPAR